MSVNTTLPGVFLKGVAASRPAANAVAAGAVYSATDTGVISQSDGSSWSTWATIAAGMTDPMTTRGDTIYRNASNVTARLALGAAGTVPYSDGTDLAFGPGAFTSYTPALTAATVNPTLGTGSAVEGHYCQVGKIVVVHGSISFGSSGMLGGTGEYYISLPVAPKTTGPRVFGTVIAYDSSATQFLPLITAYGGGAAGTFRMAYQNGITVSPTQPVTWAVNDAFVFHCVYEAA